jgi:hypothetical protein
MSRSRSGSLEKEMIWKLRTLALALALTAVVGGGPSASAAAYQELDIQTASCASTTSTSGSLVEVIMSCAATANSNATPTYPTGGVVTFTVQWNVGGFPCPSANAYVSASYEDAYGSVSVSGGLNTWQYTGNDPVTGAPLCQFFTGLTASSGWYIWGSGSYSGMDALTTTFYAQMPGLSLPVSENQGVATSLRLDVNNQ